MPLCQSYHFGSRLTERATVYTSYFARFHFRSVADLTFGMSNKYSSTTGLVQINEAPTVFSNSCHPDWGVIQTRIGEGSTDTSNLMVAHGETRSENGSFGSCVFEKMFFVGR